MGCRACDHVRSQDAARRARAHEVEIRRAEDRFNAATTLRELSTRESVMGEDRAALEASIPGLTHSCGCNYWRVRCLVHVSGLRQFVLPFLLVPATAQRQQQPTTYIHRSVDVLLDFISCSTVHVLQ